jgi:uncharacterized protein YbjT (DUF2867 family)
LIVKGAIPCVGDLQDANFVNRAFEGTTAAFCIIPGNPHSDDLRQYQQSIARNYVNAVKENDIKYVVLLSSIGAHLHNGAGVIDGLSDMEQYFSELKNVNVLTLRPTYFMENTLMQVDIIKQMGMMGSPLNGDLKFPMVATKDIAAVAVKYLQNLNFKGHTVEYILGPRDISYNEIAQIVGQQIDKPDLKYVQFSYEDAQKAMIQSGISQNVASLLNQMTECANNGKLFSDYKRTPDNSTPTDYKEFSKVVVNAFGAPAMA